jgi:hypothetical protein
MMLLKYNLMKNIKTLVVCIISVFILASDNFISKADVFAQVAVLHNSLLLTHLANLL